MKSDTQDSIRLQKFLSERGLCSRRQAEAWITEGRVKVNGQPAVLGQKVDPARDRVAIGRRAVQRTPTRRTTLIMNKPRGVLCTNHDPFGGRTVFDIIPREYVGQRLFCAGRLDKESEGLVVLTNDGALAQELTHPSGDLQKRYQVRLSRPLEEKIIPLLLKGREIEGDFLRFDRVDSAQKGPEPAVRAEVILSHGRKREIRRLFESFGYYVKRLKRVQIGGLVLRRLGPGQFRPARPADIRALRSTGFESGSR